MQAIQKTKQAEKCDGLTQSCPTTPDVENRNKPCMLTSPICNKP